MYIFVRIFTPSSMTRIFLFILLMISMLCSVIAQKRIEAKRNLTMDYLHESQTLRKIVQNVSLGKSNGKIAKLGVHNKKKWPQHKNVNPTAQPVGPDPIVQNSLSGFTDVNDLGSFAGQDYTGVSPADPTLGVGPNHVLQMVNSSFGSMLEVYDRAGNLMYGPVPMDNITGIDGFGDPIIIYDHLADRWVITEIAAGQNMISYAISTTNDPGGSWYVYGLNTTDFPDYQKWSVWHDGYYITTNEDPNAVYILERDKMINGTPGAQILQFTFPVVNNINFHSAAPVGQGGLNAPPAGEPGWIVRLMDDAWDTGITSDHIEMWAMFVDWTNLANSGMAGPIQINTSPFNTDLCGFNNYSCIPQPGTSTKLDPLKEMIMHQVMYRNFGTHQSIVMAHTVDVDGNDKSGIRWYELRNTTGSAWNIYQESTFSPDSDGRFLPAISMNSSGDILLAYNVSGNATFPSLRAVARKAFDPINQMGSTEYTIMAGTAAHQNNRYGDYNHLVIDPTNDTDFCFTGSYNVSNTWSTRINCMEVRQATLAAESLILLARNDGDQNVLTLDFDGIDKPKELEIWRADGDEDLQLIDIVSAFGKTELVYEDVDLGDGDQWYYSARLVDAAGYEIYSEVIPVNRALELDDVHFTVFPNPFEDQIVISHDRSLSTAKLVQIEVSNILGQSVFRDSRTTTDGDIILNTADWKSGMYIIQIRDDSGMLHSEKVIKS